MSRLYVAEIARSLTLLAALLALCRAGWAHDHNGLPMRLLSGQRVGPWTVSVWSHPHVGMGRFFVAVTPPPGGAIPDDLKVEVGLQPDSGELPEKIYAAHRELSEPDAQYQADVAFADQELWRVHIRLQSSEGSGEAVTTVESSLPGPARWQFLLFLLPFLAIMLLLVRAVTYRRSMQRSHTAG